MHWRRKRHGRGGDEGKAHGPRVNTDTQGTAADALRGLCTGSPPGPSVTLSSGLGMSAAEWRSQRATTPVCTFVEGPAGKRWFQLSDGDAPGVYALAVNQVSHHGNGCPGNEGQRLPVCLGLEA